MAHASEYQWAVGAKKHGIGACDPNEAAVYFAKLAKRDRLTKEIVLDEARSPKSPLAGAEWRWDDDAGVAREYRLEMASSFISGLYVKVIIDAAGDDQEVVRPVFAQVSKTVVHGSGAAGYKPVDVIMSDPIERRALLDRLEREVESAAKRWHNLINEFYPDLASTVTTSIKAIRKGIDENRPSI